MKMCVWRVSLVVLLGVAMVTSQGGSSSPPVLIHRRTFQSNLVTLVCRDINGNDILYTSGGQGPTYLYRPPADNRATPFPREQVDAESGSLVLQLRPSNEGRYSCEVGGLESETLELVAFPEPLPSIAETTSYTVSRGGTVELECEFPLGVLSQNYQYQWWNGILLISDSNNLVFDPDGRYSLSHDFSLIISDARLTDSAPSYRCIVTVRNPVTNGPVVETGREVALEVYVPVSISTPLTNLVIEEDSQLELECETEGIPVPSIRWTFNGNEITSQDASGRFTIIEEEEEEEEGGATSRLVVSQVQPLDSGSFSCTATNAPLSEAGKRVAVSSTSNITVLTNNIDELLLTTSMRPEEVFLDFSLPTSLPMPIAIMAEYISDRSEADSEQQVFERKEFNNSRAVHFRIPSDQLPQFTSFSVRIAMMAEGRMSRFTGASNSITYVSRLPTAGTQPPFGNLTETKFLAIVIVACLVVIAMVVGVVICFISYQKHKADVCKRKKKYGSFHEETDGNDLPWQALVTPLSPSPSNTPPHSPNMVDAVESDDEKPFRSPSDIV